jgi:TatD DNase family protein
MDRIIDAHCHLAARDFDVDRDEVIARARAAGVMAAVVVGEDYEDNLRVLDLAASSSFVLPAIGHHPWRMDCARRDVARTLRLIEENRETLVAIGEVGLDYRLAETEVEREEQRGVFREFIAVGLALDLPLSVHVRSAGHHVIDILREHGVTRAALHAFDGKPRYALEGAAAGYAFSIPATVLVSRQKQKLVAALPDDSLLLESDAPALGPDHGVRNEPAVMTRSLERIAEIRGTTPEVVASLTTCNARRIFGRKRYV